MTRPRETDLKTLRALASDMQSARAERAVNNLVYVVHAGALAAASEAALAAAMAIRAVHLTRVTAKDGRHAGDPRWLARAATRCREIINAWEANNG
ncbi:hypothetical protein [Afifella sp. YEN Y35]|uniref:hypothetical protein n=1 Tax=Afifella sp. YEN Y35 TaxID=3388337 RepID=UPI0039E0684E